MPVNAPNATAIAASPQVKNLLHDFAVSLVVIHTKSQVDVSAYLDRHDLITLIAASVADAINSLEIAPADCLLITSSPVDIETAQATGIPAIGYVRATGDAARLADSRATILFYSMTDLALSLRAHRLDS